MFKNILYCSLLTLIFLVPLQQDINAKAWKNTNVQVDSISLFTLKQDTNAKTWKNCKVPADSIIIAIGRNEDVLVDSCEIFGRLRYEGDTINGSIEVLHSVLHDPVFFEDCCFMKKVRFVADTLMRDINFCEVIFNRDVNFSGSIFRESASFNSSTFKEPAFFSNATFDTSIIFVQSKFLESAWFQHTIFGGDAFFFFTYFGSWADFLGATFKAEVGIMSVEFTNIFISWEQLKGHLSGFPSVHSQFIRKFEENRQLDDADGVYLFLKEQERMEKPKLQRYLEFWFIQQTCGYGIVWWRPLLTSLIVVMLFTFLYFKLVLIEKRVPLPNSGSKRFWKKLWNAFYYSINTFIVGIPANWKVENKPKDFFAFRVLTTMERTLGWILLAVFVVTLTRKFIR